MAAQRMPWLGAVPGVLAGVAIGAVLVDTLPGLVGWIALAVVIGATALLYLAADQAVKASADPAASNPGNYLRCALVGMNAGVNAALAWGIYGAFLGVVGNALAVVLGVINLAAVASRLSRKNSFQSVLGWTNLLLPLSWPIVGFGFLFWLVGLLGHLLGHKLGRSAFFKVEEMKADWKSATFFTRGGFVGNLNPIDTAFNMGTFAFVDAKPGEVQVETPEWHVEHEAGHTLNLAAFGSVFHLIGALDENVLGGKERALSERLAESNDPATTLAGVLIPMWAP
jgi:hypothetical protein